MVAGIGPERSAKEDMGLLLGVAMDKSGQYIG